MVVRKLLEDIRLSIGVEAAGDDCQGAEDCFVVHLLPLLTSPQESPCTHVRLLDPLIGPFSGM